MVWTQKLAILVLGLLILLMMVAVSSSLFGYDYIHEQLAHFQIQYWIGAILLLIVLAICQQKTYFWVGLVIVSLISVNLLTWYTPINKTAQPWLKVLSCNTWIKNQNYPAIIELVRKEKPDIAMFYEVTAAGRDQLDTLHDILPNSAGRDNGALIYTNLSLNGTKIWDQVPKLDNTTIIENIQHQDYAFTLIATHPSSPHSELQFLRRNEQLVQMAEYLAKSPAPLVIGGDFNISMWSNYYRQFVERSRITNAREGFGVIPTWSPMRLRWILPDVIQPWLSVPIDYIFTRSGTFTMRTTSMKAGPDIGSDHLPVIAEIGIVK
jgi:endonuclease/exonuclease/phosphatase (EEP) superfamily protein YafD